MSDDNRGLRGFFIGALVAGTVAAGLFLSRPSASPPPAPPSPMAAPVIMPGPGAPPPGFSTPPSDDPRAVADSLFNEAMMASEQHDDAALARVLPGALAAYRGLGPLDDDGTYHLALLELAGGQLTEARATVAPLLTKRPGHLLALGVSARAAAQAGELAAAKGFAQRLLRAYDAEQSAPLPEYRDHQRIFPRLKEEASAIAATP